MRFSCQGVGRWVVWFGVSAIFRGSLYHSLSLAVLLRVLRFSLHDWRGWARLTVAQ